MNNQYSISELIRIAVSLLLTKISMPRARLIRRPVYLRGKSHFCGGKGLTTGYGCRFDLKGSGKTLAVGDDCEFGDQLHVVAYHSVTIGNRVLLASNVFISDTDHGCYSGEDQSSPDKPPRERTLSMAPVVIGDNVWIGENAVILAGSHIGRGCIIGANSVVHGEFGPDQILAGAPARAVKRFDRESGKWERV